MKNARVTIVLVLVFAALLVGWWLLETVRPGQTPAGSPGAGRYLFPRLALENVESVEVQLRSGPAVLAFKGAEGWVLGGMGGERLDDAAVNGGVQSLIGLQAQRTFTENVSLAEFGLDVPTATIKLTIARESPESLLVGRLNPQSTSYYVQKAGKPAVYLVSRYSLDPVLGWANKPPRMPTPTAALVTVVATVTPAPPVTATVIVMPTPQPTAAPPPAVTVITVVVTPTPAAPPPTAPTAPPSATPPPKP